MSKTQADGGYLQFDEDGRLHQFGDVPLGGYVDELTRRLELFLARMDSCERAENGDYLIQDSRSGSYGGARILWDNVALLCGGCVFKNLSLITQEERDIADRGGVGASSPLLPRHVRPLVEALYQLQYSVLYQKNGDWVDAIPAATIAKIRAIATELAHHRKGIADAAVIAERRLAPEGDGGNPAVVNKPLGWTRCELAEIGQISPGKFDLIRDRAGVEAPPKGGKGNHYYFQPDELEKMVHEVETGATNYYKRAETVRLWRALLSKGAGCESQSNPICGPDHIVNPKP